jgi:signal transduction histidine kinase/ActR/RegA family two-component response regulator
MHAFFCALATVAYARASDLDRANAAARTLRQYARNCPGAFSHLHELSAAEVALAQGQASAASYERAAHTAKALGRHFDRALIHQLAASALDAARTRDEARRHAEEARIIWRQLGVMRLAQPPAEASDTVPVDALVAIAAAATLDDACQRAADAAAVFCGTGAAVALQVDEGWKNRDAAVASDAQRQRLRAAIGDYLSGTPVAEDVGVVALQIGDALVGVIATMTLPDLRPEPPRDRLAEIAPLIAPILDRARLAAELARARTDLGAELKSAQDEAALSAARERKATMDMSTFLATISHELRSPLSAIGALIETSSLASDPLSQEQASALRGAFLSLRTLADDLLDAGRADRDEPTIRAQAFNPAEAARAAARLMSDEHASEARPLVTDIAPVATSVRGDPQRLQQILVNLLSNAYRHAHEGAVHLEARFVEQHDGVRCSYAVEDEGPGLDKVPNLFESFARSSTSPGVGLGLAVSRQLATALGGTLTAANRSPTGSRFVLELVLPTASAARGPTRQLGPIHVLLVDDLQLTRISYAKLLGIEGWQVDTAESGERALEMMSVRTYDLVLIDFLLPGWDGLETLRRIGELMPDRSKRPPLILFTALPSSGVTERAMAAGADAVLAKPATRDEIVQAACGLLLDAAMPKESAQSDRLLGLIEAIGCDQLDALLSDAIDQLPGLIRELDAAADAKARQASAHRLHGFASHLGLAELATFAAQAEAESTSMPPPPPVAQTMETLGRMRQVVRGRLGTQVT